jgi:hypothetical protein
LNVLVGASVARISISLVSSAFATGVSPVLCVELEDDVADVMVDCLDADQEIDGNFLVAFSESEVSQNLYLSRCQPGGLQLRIEIFHDSPC